MRLVDENQSIQLVIRYLLCEAGRWNLIHPEGAVDSRPLWAFF